MNITLTIEQYEALIALARKGSSDPVGLDAFLKDIEKSNGITRSALFIRWQDAKTPLVPTSNFPKKWPPQLEYYLELLSRPIAMSDVLQVVQQRATHPVNILVTPDPAGLVGWTQLSTFFPNG